MRDVLPGEGVSLKSQKLEHHVTLAESILSMVREANRREKQAGWAEADPFILDRERLATWKMSVNLMFYFISQDGEPRQNKSQDDNLNKIFSFDN